MRCWKCDCIRHSLRMSAPSAWLHTQIATAFTDTAKQRRVGVLYGIKHFVLNSGARKFRILL